MSTMNLSLQDGVHVLTLNAGDTENKLDLDVVEEYHLHLDTVEAYDGNTAFVLCCEHEKTFSTGINLDWLMGDGLNQIEEFVAKLENLMLRIALLNMPTIVAINGNCYAGGAILASAFDFRFMRSDRGRFCYPEININMSFPPAMAAVIKLIPNQQALNEMALLGTAFTGEECLARNVVDKIFNQEELLPKTVAYAQSVSNKDRKNYGLIKDALRPEIVEFATQRKLRA